MRVSGGWRLRSLATRNAQLATFMNLRIFDTLSDLHTAAARTIVQRAQGGARTFALSGGSTPKGLYALLGQSEELRALPIVWIVVDERYVPIDHPDSNAGMMQQTL